MRKRRGEQASIDYRKPRPGNGCERLLRMTRRESGQPVLPTEALDSSLRPGNDPHPVVSTPSGAHRRAVRNPLQPSLGRSSLPPADSRSPGRTFARLDRPSGADEAFAAPLLADVYSGQVDPALCLVSEKYDGVRAVWDGQILRHRSGRHDRRAGGVPEERCRPRRSTARSGSAAAVSTPLAAMVRRRDRATGRMGGECATWCAAERRPVHSRERLDRLAAIGATRGRRSRSHRSWRVADRADCRERSRASSRAAARD